MAVTSSPTVAALLVEAGGARAGRRRELDRPKPVVGLDAQHGVRVADEDFLDRAGQLEGFLVGPGPAVMG